MWMNTTNNRRKTTTTTTTLLKSPRKNHNNNNKKKKKRRTHDCIILILITTTIVLFLVSLLQYFHLPNHGDFHSLVFVDENKEQQQDSSSNNNTTKKEETKQQQDNNNNNNNNTSNTTKEEEEEVEKNDPFYDKEKLMDVLRTMNVDPYSIDNETWHLVPTWSEITKVWGTEPRIYGLEASCSTFRKTVPAKKRHVAVAGLFSTGTNLMAQLLQHNCGIPERIDWIGNRRKGHGMEWQVPWGKHNPFRYRGNHSVNEFIHDKHHAKLEEYLPVVSIRDPYDWMSSMCRHAYTLRWNRTSGKVGQGCPGMLDKQGRIQEITGKFGADPNRVPFDNSLVGVWNTWYGEYFHNPQHTPLVVVRFEDIIFFSKEVTQIVCDCVGGILLGPLQVYSDKDNVSVGDFHYVVGSAVVGKGHGGSHRNGIVDAWIKYSTPRQAQRERYSTSDLDFTRKVVDRDMTDFFKYPVF